MEEKLVTILGDLNALLEEVTATKDEQRLIDFGQSLFDLKLFWTDAEKRVNEALHQIKREKGWNIPD